MPLYSTENKVIAAMQYIVLWVSLFVMLALFVFIFSADTKIPQKNVTVDVDIKNKINICQPQEKEFEEQFVEEK